jgi:hypothetical protein
MSTPSAFSPRPRRGYELDVGYMAVFLLVMGLLVGVGYHLYANTHLGMSEIEWPDPFAMGQTRAEKKLQAAVGDLSGPLSIPTATVVAAAQGGAPPVAQAPAKPIATAVPPSSIPLAALERAIMAPNDASPSGRAQSATGAAQPAAQPTVAAAAQGRMRIANTSGDGVYIRRTPKLADRIVAWPDNTIVELAGETAEGDGTKWSKVRDPRGNVGWIPTQYLAADSAPQPAQPAVVAPRPAAPIVAPGRPAAPAPQPAPAPRTGATTP